MDEHDTTDLEDYHDTTDLEDYQSFLAFVRHVRDAKDLADVNIAAGTFLQALGEEPTEEGDDE